MEKKELETVVDPLDQATLALRFYVATRQPKYLQELETAISKLHQMVKKERGSHE